MSGSTNGPGFLTLGEACQLVGMTRPTLRQRIRSGDLIVYEDLRDRRRRLVATADLKTLSEPRPRPQGATSGNPQRQVAA